MYWTCCFLLPRILPILSQELLAWRLREWLQVGWTLLTETRLHTFRCQRRKKPPCDPPLYLRTLIIVGEFDGILTLIDEAERLAALLPDTQVHVVEGAGHASTCERSDLVHYDTGIMNTT
jgi:pimeloyl-ACP methyl ester carboxylesterase